MAPNFKNPNGVRFLSKLFYETTLSDKSTVVYTLKDQDHAGYPSLYRLYMEADDPTEYQFAVTNLDGWEHWEQLAQCKWFKPYLTKWRRELETRAVSRELARLKGVAADGGKEAVNASKFLLQWFKASPERSTRGRPTKAAIQAEVHQRASEAQQIASDFERVTSSLKPN